MTKNLQNINDSTNFIQQTTYASIHKL